MSPRRRAPKAAPYDQDAEPEPDWAGCESAGPGEPDEVLADPANRAAAEAIRASTLEALLEEET